MVTSGRCRGEHNRGEGAPGRADPAKSPVRGRAGGATLGRMMSAASHLDPQLSTVIAAAMTLLAVVLAATLAVGIGEVLQRRERLRLARSVLRDIRGCEPPSEDVRRFADAIVEEWRA
jgi:hypothetical protein